MIRLDQLIDSHRDKLDYLEPEEGHFKRFQDKLSKGRRASLNWILKIAAVLFIVAFISVNLLLFRSENEDNLPFELKETAWFYNSRSEKLLSEIKSNELMDSSEKQIVINDIHNFEKEYKNILKDLKKYPGDERLINAFIEFHRSKTQFLEEILYQINATNLIKI